MTTLKQRLIRDDEAEALAARKELVKQLQRLEAAHLKELAPLQKAEDDAQAQIKEAQDALQAARVALGEAQMAKAGLSNAYNRARAALEHKLLSSAPKEIDEFISRMRILLEKISLPGPDFRYPDPRDSIEERRAYDQALRDRAAVREIKIKHIQKAIQDAGSLRLEALRDIDLEKRLDALRLSAEAEE